MNRPNIVLLTLFFLGSPSCPAVAADDELVRHRWGVDTGAFFILEAETVVRLDAANGIVGTVIDFNRVLGLEGSDNTGKLDGYYRFSNRHSIRADWYDIDRSGQKTVDMDINFGDVMFSANDNVSSDFDTQIYDVLYQYSFYNTDKVELGIQAGVHIAHIEVALAETGGSAMFESASGTAPLPVFGFHARYNFLPKLSVTFNWKTLELEFGDYGGSFRDTSVVAEHRTFKHVGFGFGLQRLDMALDATDDDLSGSFDNRWDGIYLFLMGYSP